MVTSTEEMPRVLNQHMKEYRFLTPLVLLVYYLEI